jgi:hypothetical protein
VLNPRHCLISVPAERDTRRRSGREEGSVTKSDYGSIGGNVVDGQVVGNNELLIYSGTFGEVTLRVSSLVR